MLIKCIYYSKLFLITAFSILILASVDISFDNPILFLSVTLLLSVNIHFLWHSALKDENKIKRQAKIYKKRKSENRKQTANATRAA